MIIFVLAVAVVLVVSFLCSIFESVLLSLPRPKVEMLAKQGGKAGILLAGFKDNMDVPIAAILILNTAAHTIGAAVAGASYSSVFNEATLWIFSLIFTVAVLLFTEIIPKTLGVSYSVSLAVPVAHGINLLTVILKPLVAASERISRALRRDIEVPVTSPEEIRLLAILGHSEGAVGSRTAGLIVGATQLRDLQAHQAILPRERVKVLTASMDRDAIVRHVRETGHSRFPFTATGDLNDTTGVILAKDLLAWIIEHDDGNIDWDALVLEPLIVPESVTLMQLLKTFQDSRRHLALVVDEYGTVEGIVTLEDVIEEIIGDVRDESDVQVEEMTESGDGSLIVSADVDLRRLCGRLGVIWEPTGQASTIGGLVTEQLDRIPIVGDRLEWNGFVIEVTQADRRRPRTLVVRSA
jgi:CBS domain containing-hemolysin-like protein